MNSALLDDAAASSAFIEKARRLSQLCFWAEYTCAAIAYALSCYGFVVFAWSVCAIFFVFCNMKQCELARAHCDWQDVEAPFLEKIYGIPVRCLNVKRWQYHLVTLSSNPLNISSTAIAAGASWASLAGYSAVFKEHWKHIMPGIGDAGLPALLSGLLFLNFISHLHLLLTEDSFSRIEDFTGVPKTKMLKALQVITYSTSFVPVFWLSLPWIARTGDDLTNYLTNTCKIMVWTIVCALVFGLASTASSNKLRPKETGRAARFDLAKALLAANLLFACKACGVAEEAESIRLLALPATKLPLLWAKTSTLALLISHPGFQEKASLMVAILLAWNTVIQIITTSVPVWVECVQTGFHSALSALALGMAVPTLLTLMCHSIGIFCCANHDFSIWSLGCTG